MKLPYAEDMNYWKSGQSSPDKWVDRTVDQIRRLGGKVLLHATGTEPVTGRSAFFINFQIAGERFKIVWAVLPSKSKNNKAARIQAATMLYHDTKMKCLKAAIFGARNAFFEYLQLDDGRTVSEMASSELVQALPQIFKTNVKELGSGDDVVDGEYKRLE